MNEKRIYQAQNTISRLRTLGNRDDVVLDHIGSKDYVLRVMEPEDGVEEQFDVDDSVMDEVGDLTESLIDSIANGPEVGGSQKYKLCR